MSSQNRIVVGVIATVAVLAGFWFLLLAPKRAEVTAAQNKLVQAQSRRDAATAAVAQAEQTKAHFQSDYATVARLGKAVPADDDVASLVYQLETIARANKVDFRAVKLTGTAAAAPAPTTTSKDASAATEDGKKDANGAPVASTGPVAPVVAQPPPGAVVGTAGLLTMPFSFTFDGSYMEMQRFLKAIDGLANSRKERITVRGRLLTVDGFSLQASLKGFPRVKANVSATAYLAPQDDAVSGGSAKPSPAGTTAGSPTTTALITPNAQGAGR